MFYNFISTLNLEHLTSSPAKCFLGCLNYTRLNVTVHKPSVAIETDLISKIDSNRNTLKIKITSLKSNSRISNSAFLKK